MYDLVGIIAYFSMLIHIRVIPGHVHFTTEAEPVRENLPHRTVTNNCVCFKKWTNCSAENLNRIFLIRAVKPDWEASLLGATITSHRCDRPTSDKMQHFADTTCHVISVALILVLIKMSLFICNPYLKHNFQNIYTEPPLCCGEILINLSKARIWRPK